MTGGFLRNFPNSLTGACSIFKRRDPGHCPLPVRLIRHGLTIRALMSGDVRVFAPRPVALSRLDVAGSQCRTGRAPCALRLPRVDFHLFPWACYASRSRHMASSRDSDGQVALIGVQQILPMPHRHPGASVRHWQSADAINTCLKVDASFARSAFSSTSLATQIAHYDWSGLANCPVWHRAVPNPLPCAQSNGRRTSKCSAQCCRGAV